MKVLLKTLAAVVAAALATGAATAAASEDVGDESNRLLVQISRLVQSAERTISEAGRAEILRQARTQILKLVRDYPERMDAAMLASGRAVGTIALPEIERELRRLRSCRDSTARLTFDCARARTEALRDKLPEHSRDSEWETELHLSMAEAQAGEFEDALPRLRRVRDLLLSRHRGELFPSYFEAGSEIACRLAETGFRTEARVLLAELTPDATQAARPAAALADLAQGQACAGEMDAALAALETLGAAHGEKAEQRVIHTAVLIAQTVLRGGNAAEALSVMDRHAGALLTIDPSAPGASSSWWKETRSVAVRTIARIVRALAREGDVTAAERALNLGLGVAAGLSAPGVDLWETIGRQASRNRYTTVGIPLWEPGAVAVRAAEDLGVLAVAAHSTGVDGLRTRASGILEDAILAAGHEPVARARLAVAREKVLGRGAGRALLQSTQREVTEYAIHMDGIECPLVGRSRGCKVTILAGTLCSRWRGRLALAAAQHSLGDERGAASAYAWCVRDPEPHRLALRDAAANPHLMAAGSIPAIRPIAFMTDRNRHGPCRQNHSDSLRARSFYVTELARETRNLAAAASVAAEIVNLDCRAMVFTEIAERQLDAGLAEAARATLLQAAAAVEEAVDEADSGSRTLGYEAAARRYGRIVIVLAKALWTDKSAVPSAHQPSNSAAPI